MKKFVFILMAAAGIAVACNKGEVLSPDGQKEAIENTIIEAVSLVELENWQPKADLYIQSRDTINVIEKRESKSMDNWDIDKMAMDTVVKKPYPIMLYDLTKLKGQVSYADSMYFADAQDLSAVWKTRDGVDCKAEVIIKNSDQVIRLSRDTKMVKDATGKDVETVTKEYRAIIPSSITTIVSADGKKQFQAKFTSDIKMDTVVFRPKTDKVSITAAFTADDYTASITRAKFSATAASYQASFKKGSKTILSSSFSAKGQLGFEDDDDIDIDSSTGTISINGMLMEKVGVSGTLNWGKIHDADTTFYNSNRTLEDANACAKAFEKAAKITLYIDGTAQAKLGWEPRQREDDKDKYNLDVVVRFTDGSSYMLADDYISAERYEKAKKAIDDAMDEVEKYLNPKSEEDSLDK